MHQTHHLELTVTADPLVLDRIVATCRGRRCAIRALRYVAADRHRPGRVSLTVEADARRVRLAAQRLTGQAGVLAIAHESRAEHGEMHGPGVTWLAHAGSAPT